MNARLNDTAGSIDRDHYEPSPSTGWREIAEILHAPRAHAVEPVDADVCGAYGCHHGDHLRAVTGDRGRRVLCPGHAVDYREVTA